MGAGYTKLLNYLDVGPEAPENKLKKKYLKILTSGAVPDKQELTWKRLLLDKNDIEKTAENLKQGADFIHQTRVNKQNILVCIPPNDTDAVVFATAYFMILSGLPPEAADSAITNALKDTDLKLEKTYEKALLDLNKRYTAIELREKMFKNAGMFPFNQLSEDVNKIYELAGLSKPTIELIKLDTLLSPNKIPKEIFLPSDVAITEEKLAPLLIKKPEVTEITVEEHSLTTPNHTNITNKLHPFVPLSETLAESHITTEETKLEEYEPKIFQETTDDHRMQSSAPLYDLLSDSGGSYVDENKVLPNSVKEETVNKVLNYPDAPEPQVAKEAVQKEPPAIVQKALLTPEEVAKTKEMNVSETMSVAPEPIHITAQPPIVPSKEPQMRRIRIKKVADKELALEATRKVEEFCARTTEEERRRRKHRIAIVKVGAR